MSERNIQGTPSGDQQSFLVTIADPNFVPAHGTPFYAVISALEQAGIPTNIIEIDKQARSNEVIEHWDSPRYGGSGMSSAAYVCEIEDRRLQSGQVRVTTGGQDGHVDDFMDVLVEISTPPGSRDAVPALQINFDSENQAFACYQNGVDQFLLVPQTGVRILGTSLPDGSQGFVVSDTNSRQSAGVHKPQTQVLSGSFSYEGITLHADFEAPVEATTEQKNSAFLAALAQQAHIFVTADELANIAVERCWFIQQCKTAGITLVEGIRARWDWRDGKGNVSDVNFATDEEAARDAVARLFPKSDWKREVSNNETRLGYLTWVEHQAEAINA